MKTTNYILLTVHLLLFVSGIYLLNHGEVFLGLFNIIINAIGISISIHSIQESN